MKYLLSLIIVILFFSCVTQKKMVYLQNDLSEVDTTLYKTIKVDYRLQVNDIIDIHLKSFEADLNDVFNLSDQNTNNMTQSANIGGGDLFYLTGYVIDSKGRIELPFVGKIDVLGMTTEEVRLQLIRVFDEYFKANRYYVSVKLGGLRYSALGEFNRPGKYTILQNQATIFEAIANAGDLSMVASRSSVKIIRQYPDGIKIHEINLLENQVITSPYFYIQPNDIIYVEPLKAKSWGIGTNGAQSLTVILSLLTSGLLLINAFR